MLYRSQNKDAFFCFGRGCSLEADGAYVYAYAGGGGDNKTLLGVYDDKDSAVLALKKMYDAIGKDDKMDAPTSEEIENERRFKPIPGPKWCEVPIAKKRDWRDMTIEEMDLSVRSYNCLHRTGLRTAGEVADFLAAGKTIRGFGRKSCKEVQWKLSMLQKEDK